MISYVHSCAFTVVEKLIGIPHVIRYVDLLLGEFKHYKTRIAHGGIRQEVMNFKSFTTAA